MFLLLSFINARHAIYSHVMCVNLIIIKLDETVEKKKVIDLKIHNNYFPLVSESMTNLVVYHTRNRVAIPLATTIPPL